MQYTFRLTLGLVAGLAAACGGEAGEDLYSGEASAALGASSNQARCSTCHANVAGATGYAGDNLVNIAFKTAYKGGGTPTLLAATNACVTGWMGGTALTEGDASWADLKAYLESISDASETTPNPLAPQVLADEAAYEAQFAGGDAAAGADAYTSFCGTCHDSVLIVGSAAAPGKGALQGLSAGYIARKVRTSGPPPSGMNDASDLTPGPMPFFEPDDLSDADLKNIIAHIKG